MTAGSVYGTLLYKYLEIANSHQVLPTLPVGP